MNAPFSSVKNNSCIAFRGGAWNILCMVEIGPALKRRAKALGKTDAEVARAVGISPRRYGNYVEGKRKPDYATLTKICAVLDTTIDGLLGLSPGSTSGIKGPLTNGAQGGAAQPLEEGAMKRQVTKEAVARLLSGYGTGEITDIFHEILMERAEERESRANPRRRA